MRNVIRIVNNFYNELSISELFQHFEQLDPTNLIFNAPLGNVDSYYYTLEESLEVLNRLLLYQCDNDKSRRDKFLCDLLDILNRKRPKQNTLFILSPPNAGKNYFFDAVLHYCINFGQMGNFNRYQQFPLMDCVERRIILWNEPCMEPSAVETLKMVFGGDTVSAKIKYQPDTIITRTPVIVLSNNDVFPNDAAFRSRIIKYIWKPCLFLKNCNKKPHPIAIYHLLSEFIQ